MGAWWMRWIHQDGRVAGRGVLVEHRCCVDTQGLLMVFLFP